MQILLDTHTFLWFITGNPQLSPKARHLIEEMSNTRWLSIASVWEIAIKISVGKLQLTEPMQSLIPEQLERNSIQLLPVTLAHTVEVAMLPLRHRDPFDRLLIAQSQVEGMPIISADKTFDDYGVRRLW